MFWGFGIYHYVFRSVKFVLPCLVLVFLFYFDSVLCSLFIIVSFPFLVLSLGLCLSAVPSCVSTSTDHLMWVFKPSVFCLSLSVRLLNMGK